MLRQQCVQNLRPISKIRCFESRQRCGEVDKSAPCCKVKHAQRSGYRQAVPMGGCHTCAIIHQDQIGAN